MSDETTTTTATETAAPVDTKKKKADDATPVYVATAGLSWRDGGRCEPGDQYAGPKESIEWLLARGLLAEKGAK